MARIDNVFAQRAKKRLKHARQMIDKQRFTIQWVVMDDIIDQVKGEGWMDDAEVVRRACRIWNEVCFPLNIYRTVEGSEGTMAEFMLEWLQSGYSWQTSITHLQTLSPVHPSSTRSLPETFRADTIMRLREDIAQAYPPHGLR